MSKISLEPNSSGSGTFTLAAPNSNTNRTLTLPDASGNIIAADASTGRFDSSNMPAGSVIQVVTAEKTDVFSSSKGAPFTDVPGLSVSITPQNANSQFLIILSLHGSSDGSNFQPFTYRIAKNGSAVLAHSSGVGGIQGVESLSTTGSGVSVALDSPSTSGTVTYSAQVKGEANTINKVNESINGNINTASSITVVEIAG